MISVGMIRRCLFRFADGTIHEISRDNISNFQASFLGASWFIESWDEQLIDKINDIAVGDSITIIVADRRSIDWMGERLYDGDLFVKFADDDVPIRLLPNNFFEYNVSWASNSVTSASRMITAGTDIQVAIYDEDGRSIYTADEKRTILTELVQKQEAFPKFCHFQHQNMDDWAEDYAGSSIYPEDVADDADGRVNLLNIRKFIIGEVYSSTNRGLPLPELEFRTGTRGNVDAHTGEESTDDLIKRTVVRPSAGVWRFHANVNLLTSQSDALVYMRLLQVQAAGDRPVTVTAIGASDGVADDDYLFPDDDGEPVGWGNLVSAPIRCDGETDFILIWGLHAPSTAPARFDWKGANFRWGFEMIGE